MLEKRIIALFILLLAYTTSSCSTSKGKEFWFAFMENLDLSTNGWPTFYIYVSSFTNTSGTISLPQGGLSINFNVSAGQVKEIALPQNIYYGFGDTAKTNFGFKLTTDDTCSVYVLHRRAYFSDATLILPIQELDSVYSIMAHRDESGWGFSEFVVLATSDSSILTIIPSATTRSGKLAGVPFQLVLHKGQTYQLQSSNDLTGSLVKCLNNKKIAVFGGINQGLVSVAHASHMYEQNIPFSFWGNDFIYVPYDSLVYDKLKFLAKENHTEIYIDSLTIINLNQNEHYEMYASNPMVIHSTKPITISQLCKGGSASLTGYSGDANIVFLLPLNYVQYEYQIKLRAISSLQSNYMNVITKSENVSSFLLDGQAVDAYFKPISSLSCYSYAQIKLDTFYYKMESNKGFNGIIGTFQYYDAYTFNIGFSDKISLFNSDPCIDSLTNDGRLIIPNIFTPNIDGKNDFWEIKNVTIESIECRIYNRWGRLIYSWENPNGKWDGTDHNSGERVADGIYFYILNLKTDQQKSKLYKGSIHVLSY